MKRSTILNCVVLLSIALASAALAAEEVAEPIQSGAAAPAEGAPAYVPSALEIQIAGIRETGLQRVQALGERLAAATSEEIIEIQRQIRDAKIETEAAVLNAIITDASAKGNTERAQEATLALDRLLHPEKYVAAPQPVERPIPQGN